MSSNKHDDENSNKGGDNDTDDFNVDGGGCSHYQNLCEILAPCCHRYYRCFRCHDDSISNGDDTRCDVSTMDRSSVTTIRCVMCKVEQSPPSATCTNTECSVTVFAEYVCLKCSLFRQSAATANTDTDVDEDNLDDDHQHPGIFHCDDCGICRIGKGLGISHWHCHTCCACLDIQLCPPEEHKKVCRLTNTSKDRDCCICFMPLHDSLEGRIVGYYCGHHIHRSCFELYVKASGGKITCPICAKPLLKLTEPTRYQRFYTTVQNSVVAQLWTVVLKPIVCIAIFASIGTVDSFYLMIVLRTILVGYIVVKAVRILFRGNMMNGNPWLMLLFIVMVTIHLSAGVALYGYKFGDWFDDDNEL